MGQEGSTGISIDPASLKLFADTLRSESETGLQPGVERAKREALTSVPFGQKHASGEVLAGAQAMNAALARARTNTTAQVQAAQILIDAAQRILTTYADADFASAQQLAAVEWTLSEAVRAAEKIYNPKPQQRGMLP
jgi:hypothetical protein